MEATPPMEAGTIDARTIDAKTPTPATTKPLLAVRDLSIDFYTATKVVHAVRGVSFDVAAGERVGLVGESGSGKTTTALALMRMIKPPGIVTGGLAQLGDIDLLALHGRQIREARLRHVSYVPQGAMNALNPVLRIGEQILDGVADHGVRLTRAEQKTLVATVLESVGLPQAIALRYPHQLSGGMKQRACIAIAIALNPSLIIADEPTSALDVITQRQVMKTLTSVQERMGCGLILIGHDMGLMAQVADRMIVMQDGLIAEDAPVRRLFRQPAHSYSRMLIDSVPSLGERRQPAAAAVAADDTGAAAETPLLAFDAVGKTFGGGLLGGPLKVALAPCSFLLESAAPRIVAVVGQSGSGKTTMARMILGFETPTTGSVRYRGRDLAHLPPDAARQFRREVQAVFQDPYGSFNPFYKVDRTLAQPLVSFGLARGRKAIYARMEEACAAVGLKAGEILGRFPHELSGGQRQRLMVARALLLKPRLIVADEPVSMVDASLRMSILANMQDLRTKHGISVVYITHDLATAYHVADYVLVLHEGHLVEAGPPEEVIEHPAHPYTRSLVGAIPWPDPDRRWSELDPDLRASWSAPPVIRGAITGFHLRAA
ncbi:ABC transporter ATP-binding protein [Chelatococcus asaccharovorans]|uniref:ABC transporter ATP-binding protein n=1 Tax=Chelatococcus asaccharovorans TaxID=28210 RepID=UPI00224C7866|nr:ABC transporter ATP-binding protein [Chelatococcus asaccharovorans]CAH1658081.1 Peptide/nickel transport system ATP-binding protein [Chelatococcus asaccharovorans]CAH1688853.1 Peptide/nickel transport system ATP-binding protein [Chelatococcus asaccharovorans]